MYHSLSYILSQAKLSYLKHLIKDFDNILKEASASNKSQVGATTFSVMTLIIMGLFAALGINDIQHNDNTAYFEVLSTIMLNVAII